MRTYTKDDVYGIIEMYRCLGERANDDRKWDETIALYDKFAVSEYNLPCFAMKHCIGIFVNNMLLRGIRL